MGFFRQEYCSGLPCPSLGDLPNPGNEPKSLMSPALAGGFFTISTTWGRFCWRRLLRVPWTARRSNQPILNEITPGCSLEGLMLKLKLQYLATWCEELTHWKSPWSWEGLGAGGEGDDRGWDGWMASPTLWTWVWVNSGSWWWTGRPGVLWFMRSQRVGHDWATELNWGRFLLVIHFKYSIYMTIPNSLSIPSPHPFPSNHKFVL